MRTWTRRVRLGVPLGLAVAVVGVLAYFGRIWDVGRFEQCYAAQIDYLEEIVREGQSGVQDHRRRADIISTVRNADVLADVEVHELFVWYEGGSVEGWLEIADNLGPNHLLILALPPIPVEQPTLGLLLDGWRAYVSYTATVRANAGGLGTFRLVVPLRSLENCPAK